MTKRPDATQGNIDGVFFYEYDAGMFGMEISEYTTRTELYGEEVVVGIRPMGSDPKGMILIAKKDISDVIGALERARDGCKHELAGFHDDGTAECKHCGFRGKSVDRMVIEKC